VVEVRVGAALVAVATVVVATVEGASAGEVMVVVATVGEALEVDSAEVAMVAGARAAVA